MPDDREGMSGLERDRRYNDLRLKDTFEDIFMKYAKDFTDVGDEIDLETGEIVVNNGHISRMRDEQDIGDRDAGRMLRVFSEGMVKNFSDDDADELADEVGHSDGTITNDTSEFEACEGDVIIGNITKANVNGDLNIIEDTHKSHVGTNTNLNELNGGQLRLTDATNKRLGRRPDAAAFEALGQSIALQIARFMGQWREDAFITDPEWSAPQLPVRTPTRRFLPESRSVPLAHSPYSSSGSIWALPEASTSFQPAHRAARQLLMDHGASSAITEAPQKDSRGVDDNYGDDISESNADDADASGEQILPSYLDRSHHTYSANTSAKRVGSGRKSRFTFSEADDNLLIKLKEEHQYTWATICSNWPDIPPYTVQFHYHKHLKNKTRQILESTHDDVNIEENQSHYKPSISREKSNPPKFSSPNLHHQRPEFSLTSETTSSPIKAGCILPMNKSNRRAIGTSRMSITPHSAERPKVRNPTASVETPDIRENSAVPEIPDTSEIRSLPKIIKSIEPGSLTDVQKTTKVGPLPSFRKTKEPGPSHESVKTVNSDQESLHSTKFLSISEVIVSQAPTHRNRRTLGRKRTNGVLKNGLLRHETTPPPQTQRTLNKLTQKRKFQTDESDSGDELAL